MRSPLFVVLLALPTASQLPAQRVALTHVNVVNVDRGSIERDKTILIDSGRIVVVGDARSVRLPKDTPEHDYRGMYVIPGMWEMHAHLTSTGRTSFALYVANGITGVRDMGGDLPRTLAWRDSIARGKLVGPRLIIPGPIVERERWLNAVKGLAQKTGDTALVRRISERIPVSTPESAIQAVDTIIALGADFVKVRNDASPATSFALLRHARERNIPVAGHWPMALSPELASDSGYRSLEHGALTVRNGTLAPTFDSMSVDERRAVFARLVRNGTAVTPTIVATAGYRLTADTTIARILDDSAGRIEPRLRYMSAGLLEAWRAEFALKKVEPGPPLDWAAFNRSWNRDLREMSDAGVLILAGSDAGSPLVFTGFAIADELELMVREAGLTSLQALRSATLSVGRWMKASDVGCVARGCRADLVMLSGDPLHNIANVRRVNAVVRGGQLLDRRALDALLATARR
jgi:imidazolonepropionase-like amidohydrolase